MSAPSMTLTPTHNPASARRVQRMFHGVSATFATTSASARKSIPAAISCVASPQPASAKKVELSIAASAPRMAASCENLSARKNAHAPSPSINREAGVKILAYSTGLLIARNNSLMESVNVPPLEPIELRSSHDPVKPCGNRFSSVTSPPNGPSLEKTTSWGTKLRQKSNPSTSASNPAMNKNEFGPLVGVAGEILAAIFCKIQRKCELGKIIPGRTMPLKAFQAHDKQRYF